MYRELNKKTESSQIYTKLINIHRAHKYEYTRSLQIYNALTNIQRAHKYTENLQIFRESSQIYREPGLGIRSFTLS